MEEGIRSSGSISGRIRKISGLRYPGGTGRISKEPRVYPKGGKAKIRLFCRRLEASSLLADTANE